MYWRRTDARCDSSAADESDRRPPGANASLVNPARLRPSVRTAILIATFPTLGVLLLNGFWNEPLYRASMTGFWFADGLTHVVVPAAMLVWLAARHGINPADYGLAACRGRSGELLGLTLLASALFWISYKPVATFFGHLLQSEGALVTYVDVMPVQPVAHSLVAVYFSLSAAVFEEIMYRGLPHVYFMRGWCAARPGMYVICSAVLFGLAHWENGAHEILGTACLGVFACALYLKIRTLWPLIGAHFIVDMVSFT